MLVEVVGTSSASPATGQYRNTGFGKEELIAMSLETMARNMGFRVVDHFRSGGEGPTFADAEGWKRNWSMEIYMPSGRLPDFVRSLNAMRPGGGGEGGGGEGGGGEGGGGDGGGGEGSGGDGVNWLSELCDEWVWVEALRDGRKSYGFCTVVEEGHERNGVLRQALRMQ